MRITALVRFGNPRRDLVLFRPLAAAGLRSTPLVVYTAAKRSNSSGPTSNPRVHTATKRFNSSAAPNMSKATRPDADVPYDPENPNDAAFVPLPDLEVGAHIVRPSQKKGAACGIRSSLRLTVLVPVSQRS